jgi:hypothetical protein
VARGLRLLLGILIAALLCVPAAAASYDYRGDPSDPAGAASGPQQESPRRAQPQAKCPPELDCDYVPAAYAEVSGPTDWGSYDLAKRPGDGLEIDRIVIHDTEASFDDTIDIFQTPSNYVSTQYVIRSADGHVTQMVPNRDVAYHAGNYYFNQHSIGIEIEGYALEGNTWYTPEVYESTGALIAYLADRYDFPLTRRHIIGHDEIPGPNLTFQAGMHWDPGPFFDWDRLMREAGAKKPPADGLPEVGDTVEIRPGYANNQPPVTSCETDDGNTVCTGLPRQPANFVYLRTDRHFNAPFVSDPLLSGTAAEPEGVGTYQANDWGDKAVTGQRFVVAAVKGDWTAVWYGSQKAWLYNPGGENTAPYKGRYVQVRRSKNPIPVWGAAYPSKLQKLTLGYSIPRGQRYTLAGRAPAGRYMADLFDDLGSYYVLADDTAYLRIQYNHRQGFVLAKDVVAKKAR